MADKVSRDNEIEKVYYVDILDAKEDESYTKLLELLDDYDEIKIPSYFYIKDGNVKRFVSGVSDLQEDAYEELSNEILSDEESIFKSFFINICDDTC